MTSYDFDSVFEEATEAGFGPSGDLDVGKYVGTIVSANAGESQNGDPKLGFMFKAGESSENAEGADVSGDTIWLNLTFSEKGGKYAARDAKALGLTSAMLNTDPEAAVETVVGQEWQFVVVLSKDGKWLNVQLRKRLSVEPTAVDKPAPKPRKPKAIPEQVEEIKDDELSGIDEPFAPDAEGTGESDPWDI